MNFRVIIRYAGHVLLAEAVFMLVPLFISLYEREYVMVRGFGAAVFITAVFALLARFVRRGRQNINAKDGFALVAICWILLSAFGALPLWFSGILPSYADCLFESISAFTTTGASILPEVEWLDRGFLFWRSFMQWIGGMGVLVFLLAVVPNAGGEHTMHVMKAEAPGPAPGKLVPNLRQSAKLMYSIYVGLTAIQVILYLCGGMPVFDSFCHALSTAGTGGFSVRNESLSFYNSTYIEAVTTVFMILFGVNFNIYYLMLAKNFKAVLKSNELKAYFGVYAVAVTIITLNIFSSAYSAISTMDVAFRQASFQVASILTTTGFGITNYHDWPELSRMILMILTFTGACAGSTSGGIKISRIIIIFKEIKRILFRMSHPRSYEVIKMDGKVVDKQIVHGVSTYFITYSFIFWGSLLLLSFNNCDFITAFSSVSACINNVGIGFGRVGPMANYAFFTIFSKIILMFDMLVGRLEIYPMLLLFAPHTWKKG